ncbi:hypothetical protein CVD25_17700 [Bacillus canaveralius]|uniref:Uncharacterized protein n=1 Tax=Bacillus canaveralius TaxID=1403243 RepID=A0A2N5GG80_9BACI|nr:MULTISPECIES: hypothetical protein [Bacillus]PLR79743.1 hypothetical protein CU635_21380 [Bacillus canaveralius]PLR81711.1 hypothetical protein CVD23_18215 [Bacillus sp. V33-4]PLR93153.1 hypothetical protein CVD25_17700 [Bacillus canaveralius]RSK52702.1 hypothetical protein EJA13_10615 [Bacillus canaveralius]
MLRLAVASILGFVLFMIETMIVMELKNYHTIDYGGLGPFTSVWAMNIFFVFAILTQIKIWYYNQRQRQSENVPFH